MKKIILIPLLVSNAVYANYSYVSNTTTLLEGGSQLTFQSDYFLSSNKIDSVDNNTAYSGDESFETLDFTMKGYYGFTDKFQGHLGLNFRMSQTSDGVEAQRVNGIESLIIGFKYAWKRQDGFQYAMLGEYGQRLYSVDKFQNSADVTGFVLGDNGPYANFGFNLSYLAKSKNYLSAKVLYQNPGSDLSSEIFSEFEGALVGKKVALIGGIQNISSMNQDPFASDVTQKPLIARGNTERFNSINRKLTSGYVGLNFSMGQNWILESKIYNTFAATSSDLGTGIVFGLVRRSETNKSYQKIDSAFKEYEVEGSVTKMSNTRNVAVIDKGLEDSLSKGTQVDFYHFDYVGGNELIATGVVLKTSTTKSIVKINKRFSKKRVEVGTVARIGLVKN